MVEWESGTLAVERLQGRLQRHGAGAVLKLEISKLAVPHVGRLASWRILAPAGPTERTR
ncbi:hypothetical protein [Streptomyces galilaeus]|uniref:hypothetical protein n=1 Tax=Streptomyces galilaeus TaxID=33899 RepID=UPI0038F66CD3